MTGMTEMTKEHKEEVYKKYHELVSVAVDAIQRGELTGSEGLIDLCDRVLGANDRIYAWIKGQSPADSGLWLSAYDDALRISEDGETIPSADKHDSANSNGPRKPKRQNPKLLADGSDTAAEFFARVPDWVVRDTNISATAYRLYCLLLLRAGRKNVCWPGQELLARELGLQVRQVRQHLKDLEEAGYITVQRRRNAPSLYRVNHTVKPAKNYGVD